MVWRESHICRGWAGRERPDGPLQGRPKDTWAAWELLRVEGGLGHLEHLEKSEPKQNQNKIWCGFETISGSPGNGVNPNGSAPGLMPPQPLLQGQTLTTGICPLTSGLLDQNLELPKHCFSLWLFAVSAWSWGSISHIYYSWELKFQDSIFHNDNHCPLYFSFL